MTSDRLRADDGFTLIEVLVAMVILAVGLLGLEALGIGASRMLVRAEKESRISTLAATYLEQGRRDVLASPLPRTYCPADDATEDRACVQISAVPGAGGVGVVDARRVTVTVIPAPGVVPVDTFVVSSTVYDPAIDP